MNSKGYFLVFSTAVISGFAIFINKYGVSVLNPYIFTWLKGLLTAIFLCGIIVALKDWPVLKNLKIKQWGLLLIIGLIGGSIPFLLFFKGLSLTNAAQGSFIHKTMFIYVAFLAVFFLREKLDKRFLIGGLILILGSLFLLKKIPYSINYGDLFIFIATLFWAVENIISKYTLKNLEGRTVAWARMFFGSIFIFIFLLFTNQLSLVTVLNLKQFGWVLFTSVFLFGYVITWYSGLKMIPVSKATVILILGAPITTSLSLISGKTIPLNEIIAGILIISGVVLILGLKEVRQLLKNIEKLKYVWS